MIAAIGARTRALGKDGDLLYKIPEDLARFRARTHGHPVVMGRKTWESLPENARPLRGRANVVLTRDASYAAPGATVVTSMKDALSAARSAAGSEEIFIIGGGEIYALAFPYADRLYLTLVDDDTAGDAYFPEYENEFAKETSREEHETPEGLKYAWVNLER